MHPNYQLINLTVNWFPQIHRFSPRYQELWSTWWSRSISTLWEKCTWTLHSNVQLGSSSTSFCVCDAEVAVEFDLCAICHDNYYFVIISLARVICPCVILPKENSEALQMVNNLNREYQVRLRTRTDDFPVYSQYQMITLSFLMKACSPRAGGVGPLRHPLRLHRDHPAIPERHCHSQTAGR